MNRFEQTNIWQKTLAKQLELDPHEKERELLRVEFENFREKAKILATEIGSILPEFTVHDITHIDALWETADLITKENFELTPTEAFVLGGTFLIHDLGMGLASFPNGIEELKKESIWKDTVAALFRKMFNKTIQEKDLETLDKDIEKAATENTLRHLHAKHAEKLALISWKNNKDEDIFLIENSELRESYGTIIGLIAHSHWWSVEELENKLPALLGAPSIFPPNWIIDPVKLACILRIADATQIDDRRSPSFLRTVRKPAELSDSHWNFQQKLYQPRLERNRIVYSSKSPFTIGEVDSWWLCYDTLIMIDNELKEVDSLLTDSNRMRLNAIGVASVEDPKRLSRLIAVKDWQPVDTKIKVTNVAKLVGNLGGKQLYGENISVPIREIIQNASDAIRARRILENESDDFGRILVKFGEDTNGRFIEIEDNGIGMSSRVLTGPFLDFGQSFWGSSLMHEELPGLESKGFSSTGKYGIGFFSIFMLGERVTVTSKRYEEGRDKSLSLDFQQGINSRPILRKAKSEEIIKEGGTIIKVWVKNNVINELLEETGRNRKKISLSELLENLCPSIDCNIDIEENNKITRVILANDWLTIPPISLVERIIGKSNFKELSNPKIDLLDRLSKNMTIIEDEDGQKVGRAFIYDHEYHKWDEFFLNEGIVTLGGLKSCGLTGLIGVFVGKSKIASRDIGVPIVPNEKLAKWATDQANKLAALDLDEEIQIECASIIRACGGDTNALKVAYHKTGPVNKNQIGSLIKKIGANEFVIVQDANVMNYESDNSCKINFYDHIFWVDMGRPGILQTRGSESVIGWPEIEIEGEYQRFKNATLDGVIDKALAEIWECGLEELIAASDESTDEESFNAVVGTVNDKPIELDGVQIMRKPIK
jgi:hypothetical protein